MTTELAKHLAEVVVDGAGAPGSFDVTGGYYSYRPLVLPFHSTRFVPNLAVSGTASWDRKSSVLTVGVCAGTCGSGGRPTAGGVAIEKGTIDNRRVTLRMPETYPAHG